MFPSPNSILLSMGICAIMLSVAPWNISWLKVTRGMKDWVSMPEIRATPAFVKSLKRHVSPVYR